MDNSLKDKVLEATDIVEVVGERVTLTRRGKDFVGLCPFHPDHKPSLAVSPSKQIFKCWSCGAGGDAIRFVQLRDRVDFREALVTLARRAGIELRSSPADRQSAELREQLQAAVIWARQHFQRNLLSAPGGQHALAYALQRGLTPQTIERHGLGLAPDAWDDLLNAARRTGLRLEVLQQAGLIATNESGKTYDRFRNRLIFPIADALGRPVAFGGRTLGDDPAKYLNSPETVLFSKSRVLYGLDLARSSIEERKAVIVVEGFLDAALAQALSEQTDAPAVAALLGVSAMAVQNCEQGWPQEGGRWGGEAGEKLLERQFLPKAPLQELHQ
jgi:DNA primase